MTKIQLAHRFILMFALTFTACASEPPHASLDSFARSELTIDGHGREQRFTIWIADNNPQREQGLMFVKHLARGAGMLFLFGAPQPVSMWMKNTFIPLDMLFITGDGRVIHIARDARPQSLDTIESMGAVTAVLEIGGGEAARLGIETGDRVHHQAFTNP